MFWFLFSYLPGLPRPACDWFKFVTKFTQLQVRNPRRELLDKTQLLPRAAEYLHCPWRGTHLWVLPSQNTNMKPQPAKPSLRVDEDALRSTTTTASSISRASARSSSGSQVEQGCIYNMSVCYERLRAMVPDIPARRRMSKVEILQHVIDYIQDLESALELPHLHMNNFVKDSTNNKTDRVPLSTISYNRWVARYVVLWLIFSVVSYWSKNMSLESRNNGGRP